MVAPKPASNGGQLSLYEYELVESDEMPQVNLTRSIGSECLRLCSSPSAPTSDAAVVEFECHWSAKASWFVAFLLSPFAIIVALRSSGTLGLRLTILAILVNLPFWVIHFRALRFDVVRLLVRTPEFWYFMTSSALWCAALATYLDGVRSVIAVFFFMMSLIIVLVDADAIFSNRVLAIAVFGFVVNFAVLVMVNRRAIDDTFSFAVLKGASGVLRVEDVIISGLITNTLHLVRNAYRRHREIAEQRRLNCSLLRCIVYRRRAKLQLVKAPAAWAVTPSVPAPPGHATDAKPSCVISATVVRMVRAPVLVTFKANNTVFPVDLDGPPWRKRTQVTIVLIVCAGIVSIGIAFAGPPESSTERVPHRTPAAVAALVFTSICCGVFWSLCQRQLLRHIIQSFDFLYLSVQLTIAHCCACEFVEWDARALAVLSCWLWMHLVLTSDALTPAVRTKTGFREKYLAPVPAIFLAVLVGLAVHVAFINQAGAGTRVLFTFHIGPRKFEIRALRVFLSRFVSILWWSLRVLMRVCTAREGEMVELHIKVAYATNTAAAYKHDANVERLKNQRAGVGDELRAPVRTNQVAPKPTAT